MDNVVPIIRCDDQCNMELVVMSGQVLLGSPATVYENDYGPQPVFGSNKSPFARQLGEIKWKHI